MFDFTYKHAHQIEPNVENLTKLGKRLAGLSWNYNKQHFNMQSYMKHNDDQIDSATEGVNIVQTHFCGTVMCAVGHVPIIMPKQVLQLDKEYRKFFEYTEENGYDPNDGTYGADWGDICRYLLGVAPMGNVWSFLFGGDWGSSCVYYNRTSWAAADRIAWYLNNLHQGPAITRHMHAVDAPWRGEAVRMGWTTQRALDLKVAAMERHYGGKEVVNDYEY